MTFNPIFVLFLKPKKKKSKAYSDESDDSFKDDFKPSKKRKSAFSDSEGEEISLSERLESRMQPARARTQAKYVYDDTDEDTE